MFRNEPFWKWHIQWVHDELVHDLIADGDGPQGLVHQVELPIDPQTFTLSQSHNRIFLDLDDRVCLDSIGFVVTWCMKLNDKIL